MALARGHFAPSRSGSNIFCLVISGRKQRLTNIYVVNISAGRQQSVEQGGIDFYVKRPIQQTEKQENFYQIIKT